MGPVPCIVTTATRPTERLRTRAQEVAVRCQAPYVERLRALTSHLEAHGAPLAYVVGRDREFLSTGRQQLAVDVGLLHAHRHLGADHPLLIALGPVRRVIDATLGLCHDALHVAETTGASIVGIEISAALFSLAETGLHRLAHRGVDAASRIHPRWGDARDVLPTLQADAVMLSPMFDEPKRAPPGFELLRHVADDHALDPRWLAAALQAAPRVVIKARRGQPLPAFAVPHHRATEHGKAVDYWVLGPT